MMHDVDHATDVGDQNRIARCPGENIVKFEGDPRARFIVAGGKGFLGLVEIDLHESKINLS